MTDDRISSAQGEIGKILKSKPEYVVNTSEFNDVRNRLAVTCAIEHFTAMLADGVLVFEKAAVAEPAVA